MLRGSHLKCTVLVLLLCASATVADELVLPDTSVIYDSQVILPLRVEAVSVDVYAVEVTLAFDPQVLRLDSVSVLGTVLQSWTFDTLRTSGPTLDTIKVAAATADAPVTADAVLLQLFGQVTDGRHPASTSLPLTTAILNADNATVDSGSVTVIGNDASIVATPLLLAPGDSLHTTVNDLDEDRTAGVDEVPVRFTSGADIEDLLAPEDVAGQFSASVVTVFSNGATVGDGILQVSPGVPVQACYSDSLDAAGNTVERCANVTIDGGTDGAIEATVVVQPGDSLRMRVTDNDLNSDAQAAESTAVTIVNTRTGESESLTLFEIDVDSDSFYGGAQTLSGVGPGADDDGVVVAQKGDLLRVEYVDALTSSGPAATRRDTTTTVEPFGDASGNGSVRGFDASLILDHAVGTLTLTGLDSLSANLDENAPFSPIDAFDASLVLQYRVGLSSDFPVQRATADNHPQPLAPAPRPVPVTQVVELIPTADGWVLSTAPGIQAGSVVLRDFYGQARPAVELGQAMVATRHVGGQVRIAFAAPQPSQQDRVLLLVPKANEIPIVESASFDGGRIIGVPRLHPVARTPQFRLLPATPNPFNPTTVIPFELAHHGPVHLSVINVLGQSVRVLLDASMPAGPHAIAWDGRDEAGLAQASGVYYYRLRTPTRAAHGSMTLAK